MVEDDQQANDKKFRVDVLLVLCFIAFLLTFSAYYSGDYNQNISAIGGLCPAPLVLVDCPCANSCPPTCQAGCKQPACGCPRNTFLLNGECIPSCSVFKQCKDTTKQQQRVGLIPWENSEIFHYRIGPPDFECGKEEELGVYLHFTVLKLGKCLPDPPKHYVAYVSGDVDNMQAPQLAEAKLVSCLPGNETVAWYFHVAHLRQLPSDTKILYQVGIKSNKKKVTGKWREFTSPLLAGETSKRAVLVFGDTATVGAAVVAPSVAKNIEMYNLALHMGDTSYSTNRGVCYDEPFGLNPSGRCGFDCQSPVDCNGAGDDNQEEPMQRLYQWTKLLDSTINGHVSLVSTPGNHDNDAPFALTYRARWQDTSLHNILTNTQYSAKDKRLHIQQQCKQPAFFSHDHGLLHIVTIGTEDNPVNAYEKWDGNPLNRRMMKRFEEHFGVNSPQYRWLEADLKLASQRRALVPWILIYMHRPMYHTAEHHVWCGKGGDWYGCTFLETYEPLFRKYGVNLVLAGHSHHYARSVAMYNNEVDLERGQVHILVGNAGTELIGDRWHNTPDWLAAREGNKLGYSRFWAQNATSLYWEHVLVEEEKEQVMDSVWVENLFL